MSHPIGVFGHNCFVNSDAGEVINISRLRQTDDGMDKNILFNMAISNPVRLVMSFNLRLDAGVQL